MIEDLDCNLRDIVSVVVLSFVDITLCFDVLLHQVTVGGDKFLCGCVDSVDLLQDLLRYNPVVRVVKSGRGARIDSNYLLGVRFLSSFCLMSSVFL